jgi:hypothetical protein
MAFLGSTLKRKNMPDDEVNIRKLWLEILHPQLNAKTNSD